MITVTKKHFFSYLSTKKRATAFAMAPKTINIFYFKSGTF